MTRTDPRQAAGSPPVPEPRAGGSADRFSWHAAPLPAPAPPTGRALAGGRPAGFVTRAAANVVDVALVTAVVALLYAAVAGFRFLLAPTRFHLMAAQFPWVVVTVGLGLTLYWTASWSWAGRTHGDQLMGLRVVGPRGRRPYPLYAALRAVLCVLFLPGLFWVLVSRSNRSVQDVVLRTRVLYD